MSHGKNPSPSAPRPPSLSSQGRSRSANLQTNPTLDSSLMLAPFTTPVLEATKPDPDAKLGEF